MNKRDLIACLNGIFLLSEQDKEYIAFVYKNDGQCSTAEIQRIYNLDIHDNDKSKTFCVTKGACPFKYSQGYTNCLPHNLKKQALYIIEQIHEEFLEYFM